MDSIQDIFKNKKTIKAPSYPWQDLALQIINELGVPSFKRSSVFKVCKEHDRNFIEKCLNDTKELAKEGERWRYFFKLINQKQNNPE